MDNPYDYSKITDVKELKERMEAAVPKVSLASVQPFRIRKMSSTSMLDLRMLNPARAHPESQT